MKRGQLQVGQRRHRPAILPIGGDEFAEVLLAGRWNSGHDLFGLVPFVAAHRFRGFRQ